jgi:enoyl-CoA hydratase
MSPTDEIHVTAKHGLGRIVLDRPAVLNAITYAMVTAIADALDAWEADPEIRAVVIEGAGEKAFCAGGDVLAVSEAGRNQTPLARDFFQAEYRLNRRIALYSKPYVPILDGIVMGGGVGVSVHGGPRVATEGTLFAMPETGIGLFPDVGGSQFLSRCPGEIGTYLGLTGARLKAADLLAVGLVDFFVPRDLIPDLLSAMEDGAVPQEAARALHKDPGPAPILDHRAAIDRIFGHDSVEEIVVAAEAEGDDFSANILRQLSHKSPTMLKVGLEQLRRGRRQDLDANMRMEYRLVRRALRPDGDFHEGVRALLIDKDKTPHWSSATLEAVTDEMVAAYFEPPEEGDLSF